VVKATLLSRLAGILDVVSERLRNIADIAGAEVDGARGGLGEEHGHAAAALEVICHSSAFGCQCNSRKPAGFKVTCAMAM
jgi:hypothetical protein